MTTKRIATTTAILAALSLSSAQFAVSAGRSATGTEESRQTLKEIQASATVVENEAEQLRMAIENPYSTRESSLPSLISMRGEVNRMGREVSDLEAERSSLAPWEQAAIDKTLPLLQSMASDTTGAIEYFNNNSPHLWSNANRGYADRIYKESKQTAKTLNDYLKYASAYDQTQRLEACLKGAPTK